MFERITVEYVAEDGTPFASKEACIAYESGDGIAIALSNLVCDNIGCEYCDDAGFSIIQEGNVVGFIMQHYKEICAIVEPWHSAIKATHNLTTKEYYANTTGNC